MWTCGGGRSQGSFEDHVTKLVSSVTYSYKMLSRAPRSISRQFGTVGGTETLMVIGRLCRSNRSRDYAGLSY